MVFHTQNAFSIMLQRGGLLPMFRCQVLHMWHHMDQVIVGSLGSIVNQVYAAHEAGTPELEAILEAVFGDHITVP